MTLNDIVSDLASSKLIFPDARFILPADLQARVQAVVEGEGDEREAAVQAPVDVSARVLMQPQDCAPGHNQDQAPSCTLHCAFPEEYPRKALRVRLRWHLREDPCSIADASAAVDSAASAAAAAGLPSLCDVLTVLQSRLDVLATARARAQSCRDQGSVPYAACHGQVTASGSRQCAAAQRRQVISHAAIGDLWARVVHIHHMRSRKTYLNAMKGMAKQLRIACTVYMLDKLIALRVLGSEGATKQFMVRLRKENVDVDSKGNPCKERMATVVHSAALESHRDLDGLQFGSVAEVRCASTAELMWHLQAVGVPDWPFR